MKESILLYLETEGLNQTDKILIVLLINVDPLRPKAIQNILDANGIKEAMKWNISQLLKINKNSVLLKDGWTLTTKGKEYISKKISYSQKKIPKVISKLHEHLKKVTSTQSREFIEEAVRCFEGQCYRAAVVLSWSGAIGILYENVLNNKLVDFNRELVAKFPKSKPIQSFDDFSLLKENDFLEIAFAASVIDKNLKMHLQHTALKLRNSCGHPNSFKVLENQAQAHLELLLLNVYEKF